MNESNASSKGSGLSGSLKVIAGLCVLALAVLAVLLVLEVIPQSEFRVILNKVLLLALVAALASVALGVLARLGRK